MRYVDGDTFRFVCVDGSEMSATFVVESGLYHAWENEDSMDLLTFERYICRILDNVWMETEDGIYTFRYNTPEKEETVYVSMQYEE